MHVKHTRGPWQVEQAFGYKIRAAGGKLVAEVSTLLPLTWESPANAYLIAAAPDLLLACHAALAELEKRPAGNPRVLRLLRDAVARASGATATGWMPVPREERAEEIEVQIKR